MAADVLAPIKRRPRHCGARRVRENRAVASNEGLVLHFQNSSI